MQVFHRGHSDTTNYCSESRVLFGLKLLQGPDRCGIIQHASAYRLVGDCQRLLITSPVSTDKFLDDAITMMLFHIDLFTIHLKIQFAVEDQEFRGS